MHPATWWPALTRMSLVHTTRRRAIAATSVLALIAATLVAAITASAPAAATAPAASEGRQFRVLVFTKAVAGTHASTNAGVAAIEKLGQDLRFTVQVTNDAAQVRPGPPQAVPRRGLPQHRPATCSTPRSRPRSRTYYRDGGGFVGIHSAIETEPDWSFLTDVLGTRATGSSAVDAGDHQGGRPRAPGLGARCRERWNRTDQWYNFTGNVRGRLPRAGHRRRDDLHRWHDGLRPPDHLVQGLPGRPFVLHRSRRHRRPASAPPTCEPTSVAPSSGRPA